jgi:hypothetical protein
VATAWLMALVVRDAWSPRHDPVRNDGVPEHKDDPGGGVLNPPPPPPPHDSLQVPGVD